MEKLKNHPAYKMARDAYGFENELGDLQEECGELIAVINRLKKFRNGGSEKYAEAFDSFLEEMGDVENLIQQMKYWFPQYVKVINTNRIDKLDRLEKRIKEGYEQHKD
jgi:NTP pyrophosphatase (non-canonical NTP hydrolase)